MGAAHVLEYEQTQDRRPAAAAFLVRAWPALVAIAIIYTRGIYTLTTGLDDIQTPWLFQIGLEFVTAALLLIAAIVSRRSTLAIAAAALAIVELAYLPGLHQSYIGLANFMAEAISCYCLAAAGWVLVGYAGQGRGWEPQITTPVCGLGILVAGAYDLWFYAEVLHWALSRGITDLWLIPTAALSLGGLVVFLAGIGVLFRLTPAARVGLFAMILWVTLFYGDSIRTNLQSGTPLWQALTTSNLWTLAIFTSKIIVAWGAAAARQLAHSPPAALRQPS